jgi:non-specific serine/threonine protein kinase/serine/threonine-protein kinase
MSDDKDNKPIPKPDPPDKNAAPAGGEATFVSSAGSTATSGKRTDRSSIGPYVFIKKLGEGGMGQVWLAEQTAPVRRQVALKLIRVGMYDDSVLLRFQSEQQSLAVMNHPTIAKVFDAGSTPDGQPYFVMEFVDGPSITKYCDNKKLKIRDRLELFIKVCEGVQHAHQKAIIHRDLKPSNILVAEVDGKPMPRIIDFGIAKAISSQSNADQTMFTQVGAMVGTPGFMSPEQADPTIQDVDTRTDVYSLGVILYALLTGMLPFDTDQWKKRPIDEVLRQLREDDPPSPSTKLNVDKQTSTAVAERRGTMPKQLAGQLHGDLDAITLKAVEKDRVRRYGTPSELAADIQRYLSNEPVQAQPPTTSYRLQKYVRRHRVAVSIAAGVALLLAGFVVVQAVQLRRITRERDRANRITDFMTNMFKDSDPGQSRGNTITVREVLDKASSDINTGLAKDPELQAQLLYVMATVYDQLGLFAKSESLSARSFDIRLRALGPRNAYTLDSQAIAGFELWRLGRYPEAEKLLRDALAVSQKSLGLSNLTTIGLQYHLSLTLADEGRYPEAETLAREALESGRRSLGPENAETMRLIFGLSAILGDEGKYPESEKLNREALDLSRRIQGPEHPGTIGMMSALADTLSDEGRYAEAEQVAQQALDVSLRINGPDHPRNAGFLYNLACLAALQGQPDRALSFLQDAVNRGLQPKTALGIATDSDLQSLHGNPAFDKIVSEAKPRAVTTPTPK